MKIITRTLILTRRLTTCHQSAASTQVRAKLPFIAKTCDKHSVSDRAAAAIAAAASGDVGDVTVTDYSKIIDRGKVRQAKLKCENQ